MSVFGPTKPIIMPIVEKLRSDISTKVRCHLVFLWRLVRDVDDSMFGKDIGSLVKRSKH